MYQRAQVHASEKNPNKWGSQEDDLLRQAVDALGHSSWVEVAEIVSTRDSKQCLQRWKAIDPSIRRGRFTADEDDSLLEAHKCFGEKWCDVAKCVIGRSDMQCRERYFNHFKHNDPSHLSPLSEQEIEVLKRLVNQHGPSWSFISKCMNGRADHFLRKEYKKIQAELSNEELPGNAPVTSIHSQSFNFKDKKRKATVRLFLASVY
jgi:hypothetical protein